MSDTGRRNPRAERTRAALIAAGRRLFSERPVDAVTVDDIVGAADVGKGSFYNHFADREALFQAISDDIRAAIEDKISRANAGVADPAHSLARAVCIYLRYAVDEPEPAQVLVRIHTGLTSLDAPVNRGVVGDISKGLAEGRFTVATLEAGVLYVMGVNRLALARVTEEPSIAVGLAQQMCALLLRGFGLSAAEADLIAAQASDEIVREGAFSSGGTDDA
jgi:AcrR family transcriptional regulator